MITYKLIAAVLVLMAGLGGGLLATRITKHKGHEKITGLANTFAGGVFLGAAFLHMLPDAIENFNLFLVDFDYPVFALVAAMGFLLVMLLDKILAPAFGGGRSANAPRSSFTHRQCFQATNGGSCS